jgi:hypothetical protein
LKSSSMFGKPIISIIRPILPATMLRSSDSHQSRLDDDDRRSASDYRRRLTMVAGQRQAANEARPCCGRFLVPPRPRPQPASFAVRPSHTTLRRRDHAPADRAQRRFFVPFRPCNGDLRYRGDFSNAPHAATRVALPRRRDAHDLFACVRRHTLRERCAGGRSDGDRGSWPRPIDVPRRHAGRPPHHEHPIERGKPATDLAKRE